MAGRKKQKKPKLPRRLDDLIANLTVPQLRAGLAALSSGPPRAVVSHDDAKAAIEATGRDVATIEATLYAVEQGAPFSRCFLANLAAPVSAETRAKLLAAPADEGEEGIGQGGFRFAYATEHEGWLYLTFERDIAHERVVWSADRRTAKRLPERRRHPAVVAMDVDTRRFLITYPGFTQGSVEKARKTSYEEVVRSVLEHLRVQFGVTTSALPVRECVNQLWKSGSKRFFASGTSAPTTRGRFQASGASIGVEFLLEHLFGRHLPQVAPAQLREALAEALRGATLDSLVLWWSAEKLMTRLNFWDFGTELYVVWHETDRSYSTMRPITDLLFGVATDLLEPTAKKLWDFIGAAAGDTLLLPGDLVSRTGVSEHVLKEVAEQALRAGVIRPVYALIGPDEVVDELPNGRTWSESLLTLRKVFTTAAGEIDGRDPDNIQVAFRRVGGDERRHSLGPTTGGSNGEVHS